MACAILVAGLVCPATVTLALGVQSCRRPSELTTLSQLGATVGAQYHGDGLSVAPTPEGAWLRCVFLKLEGQVKHEGSWLASTAEPQTGQKLSVVAQAVGHAGTLAVLPPHGIVSVAEKLARYVRPGLTEEYVLSMDGTAGLCSGTASLRGCPIAGGTSDGSAPGFADGG